MLKNLVIDIFVPVADSLDCIKGHYLLIRQVQASIVEQDLRTTDDLLQMAHAS